MERITIQRTATLGESRSMLPARYKEGIELGVLRRLKRIALLRLVPIQDQPPGDRIRDRFRANRTRFSDASSDVGDAGGG